MLRIEVLGALAAPVHEAPTPLMALPHPQQQYAYALRHQHIFRCMRMHIRLDIALLLCISQLLLIAPPYLM